MGQDDAQLRAAVTAAARRAMPPPPGRRSRSYSQLSQWLQCPRQYELSRIVRVPRKPGWWFPGGTAVHATVERYLREKASEGK